MGREIQLDGAEISVIKALGTGGSDVDGLTLIERCQELDFAEIADTLRGLIAMGYADADSDAFHGREEFEKLHFRVNSGYAKDLREMLDSRAQPKQTKRVRRE